MLKKLLKLLFDKNYRFIILFPYGVYDKLADEEYIKRKFEAYMGIKLNLDNPKTYSEKLQWLKLNDRKEEYVNMVDKYKAREYVKNKIGEQYLIPLLGCWKSVDEINFDELPNQFVMKCNHNSGLGMIICKDKKALDVEKAKKELSKGLKQDFYLTGREWPYKNVERRIVAEKFMIEQEGKDLKDYKVFNFNGKPQVILVCQDRFTHMTEDYFDVNWNHLPIVRKHHGPSAKEVEKPEVLDEMLRLSEILSKDIPFLRTDFYVINNKIYFGEMTFYPTSGFEPFIPDDYDYVFGDWLDLGEEKCAG